MLLDEIVSIVIVDLLFTIYASLARVSKGLIRNEGNRVVYSHLRLSEHGHLWLLWAVEAAARIQRKDQERDIEYLVASPRPQLA